VRNVGSRYACEESSDKLKEHVWCKIL